MQQNIKVDDRMAQNIVDHAELAPERRFFTQGYGRLNVPGHYQNVNQSDNRIWSFQQALVYCISELLDKFFCHELTFTSSSTFC